MSVSSSPPGCRSFGQNCRTGGPWCFAGWAGRCPSGVSGKGLRSSRPPSAASTPRQTWTTAPAASLKAANAHRVTQSSQRSVNAIRGLALVTFLDVGPQLVFTGAFLKGFWEFDGAGAEIPEEDPKRVHVDGVIVLSCAKNPSTRTIRNCNHTKVFLNKLHMLSMIFVDQYKKNYHDNELFHFQKL